MIPQTYCGLSGLTKITVELNLDPLMESRSAPLFIMEVFLLLFLRVKRISRNMNSEGFKNWCYLNGRI